MNRTDWILFLSQRNKNECDFICEERRYLSQHNIQLIYVRFSVFSIWIANGKHLYRSQRMGRKMCNCVHLITPCEMWRKIEEVEIMKRKFKLQPLSSFCFLIFFFSSFFFIVFARMHGLLSALVHWNYALIVIMTMLNNNSQCQNGEQQMKYIFLKCLPIPTDIFVDIAVIHRF